jgi:exodeoxyribonuclease VII small subunit
VELDGLSFEEAYRQLEEVVRRLESDELTVDQSVELYELGMRLIAHCNARLDGAELRIAQLLPGRDGELTVGPLTQPG